MPLPKEHAFMAACPDEHKAELTECMAAQPQVVKGPILDLLAELRTSKVPLSQILALFPLITAAFASPLTGMVPLALAIAAPASVVALPAVDIATARRLYGPRR